MVPLPGVCADPGPARDGSGAPLTLSGKVLTVSASTKHTPAASPGREQTRTRSSQNAMVKAAPGEGSRLYRPERNRRT